MATPKLVQLYKNKLLSDSGTETLPLKRNDMIVGLNLIIRAENGSSGNTHDGALETTIEQNIDKIEVRSGSAVFKSYDGEMCRKIATYRNGKYPNHIITGAAGGTWTGFNNPLTGWQHMNFPIDFCTKQDPYGNKTGTIMPAPLYDSLDLVIDDSFAVATTGITTGTVYADVYAMTLPKLERQAMEGKRVLIENKKADYTSVATGDESFDLTLDSNRFLRHLYVNAYENGIDEGVDITELQLKVEGNNEISGKWGVIQEQNAIDCDLNYHKFYYMDTGDASCAHWSRVPSPRFNLTAGEAQTVPVYASKVGDIITVVNDNGEVYYMDVSSAVVPGMAVLDFDRDGLMGNMQYCGVKDLDLIMTNGGAGAAVQVLEQHISKAWGY